jgi:hypothetical protein
MSAWLDPVGPHSRAVYWRRRVASAAALLLALFLVGRACGSDQPPDLIPAGVTQTPVPLVSTYTPTPAASGAGLAATDAATDAATTDAASQTAAARNAPASQTAASQTTKAQPVRCSDGDVEVTVRADARRYAAKAKPKLTISVANRSARACTFDVGSKALTLVVTSGKDRIWSSADCRRAVTRDVRLLKPGEAFAAAVVWSKVRSAPGCPKGQPAAKPGTYLLSGSANGVEQQRRAVFLLV